MQDRPPFVMHVVYNDCCYVLRAGEGGIYGTNKCSQSKCIDENRTSRINSIIIKKEKLSLLLIALRKKNNCKR